MASKLTLQLPLVFPTGFLAHALCRSEIRMPEHTTVRYLDCSICVFRKDVIFNSSAQREQEVPVCRLLGLGIRLIVPPRLPVRPASMSLDVAPHHPEGEEGERWKGLHARWDCGRSEGGNYQEIYKGKLPKTLET